MYYLYRVHEAHHELTPQRNAHLHPKGIMCEGSEALCSTIRARPKHSPRQAGQARSDYSLASRALIG
jgi:hypothetical protein